MFLTMFYLSISGQQVDIAYDTLMLHTNRGFPVSLFETIRDKDSLNKYFLKIGYDTLRASKKPDFDSEMVIAVVTAFFGGDIGNIEHYYKIKKITEEADSIVVNIQHDSLVYNTEIQHAYSISMLIIPRSDKTVSFRIDIQSAHRKPIDHAFLRSDSVFLPQRATRLYDIKGRVLCYKLLFDNGIVLQSTPYGNKKILFIERKFTE
jgi:hypothetical protein